MRGKDMTLMAVLVCLALGFGTNASMLILRRNDLEPKFFRVNTVISAVLFIAALFLAPSFHSIWYLIIGTILYSTTVLWLPIGFERGILLGLLVWGGHVIHQFLETHGGSLSLTFDLISVLLSGFVMGVALVSMNVGHWYLSATKFTIRPLRNITLSLMIGVFIRLIWLIGVLIISTQSEQVKLALESIFQMDHMILMVVAMVRVLFGVIGPMILAWMTWETVKLEATQSATGILYALLALVLVGEASGLFLTLQTPLPF